MYRIIDFGVSSPRGPRYADEAREMVARVLDNVPGAAALARELMYGQVDGVIACRFLYRKGGFSLLGLGERGSDIVTSAAHAIALELCRDLGGPVTIASVKDGVVGITPVPYMRRYMLRQMVHQKKPHHPIEPSGERLQTLLERSILRQARMLGLDVPELLRVVVHSYKPSTPVLIAGNAYAAAVKDVIFDVNAALSGWWGFGYLLSRGYGAMHAEAAAQMLRTERWEARHEAVA